MINGGMYSSTSCLIDLNIFSTCWLLESSVPDFVIHCIWEICLPVNTKTPLHSYRCSC
ncbi:uncharacterized protein LACBIDRAFT_309339 [Laccaria bicolor S238N-H82]|uniref:Predicted protein n=1 Tax=Laccaria bicolor (strain S238N-H82 / ATCC MYA-4686) TaxID=486041 RepID=B0E4N9_LACBS|nr:uncharacterized protein LACBIDRAFT_309339 [Laccaria bicolor S238N-H82]EDQ98191.1 predicted protein [Laccaria bicolor S238N-H82]|eukprot:XP_001891157.1 predicted protein [Laccaria bicolor S238N-H82]